MDLNINCPTTVKKTLKANPLTKLSQSIWRKHTLMSVLALLMVFCIPVNRTNASNVSSFTRCVNPAFEIAEDELNMALPYSIYLQCLPRLGTRNNYGLVSYGTLAREILSRLNKRINFCVNWHMLTSVHHNPVSLQVDKMYARYREAALKRKVVDIISADLLRTCPRQRGRTTVETRLALWNKFVHNVSGKLTKASKGNDVKIINLPNGTWAIKSSRNNKYLSSENGTKVMKFNRKSIGAWEEFSPGIKRINGKLSVTLKASNGKSVIVKEGALWAKGKEPKYIFLFR